MNRLLLLLVLCFANCHVLFAQNRHALIIGIGDYPSASGWGKINGDNDVKLVSYFLKENNFKSQNITVLKNSKATKENIVKNFKAILAVAQKGDCVYIHFSGHGQQVTDVDGDEVDGYDEAWIPYDANKYYIKGVYEGEQHLIDDEINEMLFDIRKKITEQGKLIVVVDACHSGDSSRGDDDELIIRGSSDNFIIPIKTKPNSIAKKQIAWTMISACKSYQNNYECKVGTNNFGSLSYSLYLQRNMIAQRQLSEINTLLSEQLAKLVYRPQTIQIDSFQPLENQKLFDRDDR